MYALWGLICLTMCLMIIAHWKHEKVTLICICTVYSARTYAWLCVRIRCTVYGHFCSWYFTQHLRTALHYASWGCRHDTVRELLEIGANPNMYDKVRGVYNMYSLQCL